MHAESTEIILVSGKRRNKVTFAVMNRIAKALKVSISELFKDL
jgi:hypothetical protein